MTKALARVRRMGLETDDLEKARHVRCEGFGIIVNAHTRHAQRTVCEQHRTLCAPTRPELHQAAHGPCWWAAVAPAHWCTAAAGTDVGLAACTVLQTHAAVGLPASGGTLHWCESEGGGGQLRTDAANRQRLIMLRLAVGARPIDVARELDISTRTVRRATADAREELNSLFSEALTALARRALEGGPAALAVLEEVSQSPGSPTATRVAAAKARLDVLLRLAVAVAVEDRLQELDDRLQRLGAPSR
jgi:hypothetical protein